MSTVVVTGAGRGIGRAIALDLAERSQARLLLTSASPNHKLTANFCNGIRQGCAYSNAWNLPTHAAGEHLMMRAVGRSPGPIGLVHCAGVLGPTGPFITNDPKEWWKAMEVNLMGTITMVKALLPRMLADKAGRIVLFAGGGAAYGYPNFSSYGCAKAALVRFAETLAMELGDSGPTVKILAPGANNTDMLAKVRAAGGIVRTIVTLAEPCAAVRRLLFTDSSHLHGRFVHVRDDLENKGMNDEHFKLRRVE